MPQRYFIAAEATYEILRQQLNTQLGYPNSLGQSIFHTPLQAPRDSFRRVLLAVDTSLPGYATVNAALAPLLSGNSVEELDEATYLTAVNSASGGGGVSSWNDLTDKPSTFPPSSHQHVIADTTGLQAALDGKASTSHIHLPGDISGLAPVATSNSYNDLQDKPQAYSLPTATGSVLGGVKIGSGVSIDGSGVISVSTNYAAASHTQAWTTITATPTTLAGYGITDAVSSTDARLTDARTPLAHNQAWSTITSTPTTLAGYGITDAASASHAHPATDITSGTFDIARIPSLPASQIGSGTLAVARLPVSTAAQSLAGTDTSTLLTPAAMHVARRGSGRTRFWELFTDFTMDFSGNFPGSDGFIFGNQSSGTGAGMNLFANVVDSFTNPTAGILTVTTGTTNAGRGGFDSWTSRPHRSDTGTTTFEVLLYIPTLASVAEDYVIRVGYVKGNGIDFQCVCFEYDRSASTNWRCVTADLGNFTRSTTSVAVAEAKWIKLSATWTSASATFFINDASAATLTSNIRPGSQWPGGHIIKTAGTTARTFLLDYFYVRHDFSTERTFT